MKLNKGTLAFDFGSSSGRLILGVLDEGNNKISIKEIHRFENKSVVLNKNEYWDFLYLFNELKAGLKKASLEKDVEIVSLGIDTWGVDYGWIDEDGDLLYNPICYRDQRTESIINEVHSKISKFDLFKESGNQFYPFNTLYQIYYDIYEKKILEKGAKKFLFLPNLFAYYLTGKESWEYTIASTSGLLNSKSRAWSGDIFEKLKIPKENKGEIKESGTILGEIKREIIEELGINNMEVILTASHDSAAAAAGAPLKNKNSLYIINGTWSLLGIESEMSVLTEEAFRNNIINEGGVNKTVRVLKMIPGLWILQQLRKNFSERNLNIGYEKFGEMAKSSNIDSFVNLEDERFLYTKNMEKEIKKYCIETKQIIPETEEDLLRTAYNSLKKEYKKGIDTIKKITNINFEDFIAIGGGIQDKFLCQEVANELGREIRTGPIEASAFGNIITQFISLGLIESYEKARKIIESSSEISVYYPRQEVY